MVTLFDIMAQESDQFLKELEELEKEELKKKHELEKLKAKIKDTAKQARERKEFEDKVPIGQVASENATGMSVEEKQFLEAHKGKKIEQESAGDEAKGDKDSLEKKTNLGKKGTLEGTVESEAIHRRQDIGMDESQFFANQNYQQIVEMSQRPMAQLYNEMKSIYDTSLDQGYVTTQNAAQTFEIESAIERKLQDIDSGNYQFTSEQTERAASVSLSMKDKVSAMYVAGKEKRPGNGMYQV